MSGAFDVVHTSLGLRCVHTDRCDLSKITIVCSLAQKSTPNDSHVVVSDFGSWQLAVDLAVGGWQLVDLADGSHIVVYISFSRSGSWQLAVGRSGSSHFYTSFSRSGSWQLAVI